MGSRAVRAVVVVGVAAAFALAWRHELFLIVIVMPAAAVTLSVHARNIDRSHARRAAALALVAPTGVSDPAALERLVAADLAAASLGDSEIIEGALALAEETIDDPWQRALACERLGAATYMLTGTPFTGGTTGAAWRRPWVRVSGVMVVAGLLVAIAATEHKALLVPLALAFGTLTFALSETRRAEGLRSLLVRQTSMDPANGQVVVPDEAVRAAIRSLVSNNPRVRAAASSIVEAWPGPEHVVARCRLGPEPAPRVRISRLDREIVACGLAAVLFAALLEAL